MQKKNSLVVVALLVLLLLLVAGKSYLRQRDAMKIVRTVLTYWQNNDPIPAMSYWEKELDSPPIYNLSAYEIGEKHFDKNEGRYRAHIDVTLYFPDDHHFPSGKEWRFELIKTRYGWKIIGLQLQE
ncbi:MAG TPA: hypothetical protein PKV41_00305 [Candidatus Omnitrophota bacterium]|nr:hypothetical protein [Candidatus Omnitrophota bacterium]